MSRFVLHRHFIVATDPESGEEVARTELLPPNLNARRGHVSRTAEEITIPAGSVLELRVEDDDFGMGVGFGR